MAAGELQQREADLALREKRVGADMQRTEQARDGLQSQRAELETQQRAVAQQRLDLAQGREAAMNCQLRVSKVPAGGAAPGCMAAALAG